MKKLLALLLTMTLCLSLLASCVSTSGTTEDTSTAPAAATEQPSAAPVISENPEASDTPAIVDVVNLGTERDPTDMSPWAGNMGGAETLRAKLKSKLIKGAVSRADFRPRTPLW